jgi:hypothetical protein
MTGARLVAIACRAIPSAHRSVVLGDLEEEAWAGHGALWVAAQAVRAGLAMRIVVGGEAALARFERSFDRSRSDAIRS